MISFLLTLALLWPSPAFRFTHDHRESDGYRYTSLCVLLYQRAETMACVEVARG
jgi:hypothetical protein